MKINKNDRVQFDKKKNQHGIAFSFQEFIVALRLIIKSLYAYILCIFNKIENLKRKFERKS